MSKKQQILELRQHGKSYNEIVSLLNCTKSLVCYYCGKGQKDKFLQRQKTLRNKQHPFQRKMEKFKLRKVKRKYPITDIKSNLQKQFREKVRDFKKRYNMKQEFSLEDIINKVGENPICYLTGESINIDKPSSYEFDHIIPISRGGNNSLENLGIATKAANQCKSNMTPDELIFFCKKILEHNGYEINKAESFGVEPNPV